MKKIIKKLSIFQYIRYVRYINVRYRRVNSKGKNLWGLKSLFKVRVYFGKSKFTKLLSKVKLDSQALKDSKFFYYSIDPYKTVSKLDRIIGNLSVDYKKVTDMPLESFRRYCNQEQNDFIDAMETYANRIADYLESNTEIISEKVIFSYRNIASSSATGLQDALQRILFINQIIWQCGHRLIGLGRLDKILYPFYQNEKEKNPLAAVKAKEMIKEFLCILHKDYWFKGDALSGDTGQIIILGGINSDGDYECNELTYLFIELIKELHMPDPKILLRVSSIMPRGLMAEAVNCVKTGNGSPLFSNDDIVIPALIGYGYRKQDVFNYTTSACWEPLIAGKSSEQNNCEKINYAIPLTVLINKLKKNEIKSYEELKQKYFENMDQYIKEKMETVSLRKYQTAPVLSIFTERTNKNDISERSAIYSDYGITTVGLSNVVNSFLVIYELVWKRQKYSFDYLASACRRNYLNEEALLKEIADFNKALWGSDDEKVIALSNEIISQANDYIKQYQDLYKIKVKIGLSSPDYIAEGKHTGATPDGRKKGMPLGVHISTKASNAYTEIIKFASQLNMSGLNINGNVVDLMVSPGFIETNLEKFIDFMMLSINVGFFEMQMNVVSSDILIKAKKNPEQFPDLIVRVWGFSAYFNELPESYKDILIERALNNEGVA